MFLTFWSQETSNFSSKPLPRRNMFAVEIVPPGAVKARQLIKWATLFYGYFAGGSGSPIFLCSVTGKNISLCRCVVENLAFLTTTKHMKCCQFRCRVLVKICTSVQFTDSGYQQGKENDMKFKFYHPCLSSVPRHSISSSRSPNLIRCDFFFFCVFGPKKRLSIKNKNIWRNVKTNSKYLLTLFLLIS